jgi:hypothetical protein
MFSKQMAQFSDETSSLPLRLSLDLPFEWFEALKYPQKTDLLRFAISFYDN